MKSKIMALCLGLILTSAAHSGDGLIYDNGDGLIYDSVLDITWRQEANYTKTSGYHADGIMTWEDAYTWAGNLSFGRYNDWLLFTLIAAGTPACNFTNNGTYC